MCSAGIQRFEEGTDSKMELTQSGIFYTLNMIRESIMDYQETRGIIRTEEVTFIALVKALCTEAYSAAILILAMLWNLIPLVDEFIHITTFFLDKAIDITRAESTKDQLIKGVIFLVELIIIMFIISTIVELIFLPISQLVIRLFSKLYSMGPF